MRTTPFSSDDALLARLQAPPDLRDGTEALAYWRGRRRRLPWYRVAARREATRMTAAWEKRVRAALLRQRGVPTMARIEGGRLIAGIWFRRSARRLVLATVLIGVALFVLTPALLVVDLLLRAT